ncbi:hypothetical protein, partial [Pseudomonas syringae group genomosp. 7]|uniref:hypothetical protein n=1 Tax=Pseudomonas syringae group genomosp. 7 TaxID=251699 RepID=UPI0037707093
QLHYFRDMCFELIVAVFDTCHAYVKSNLTVKSCVGSSWCRYGGQDSGGLALRFEERDKGLRWAHKLKLGVYGCSRGCA